MASPSIFAGQYWISIRTAWETFGHKNGDPTFERFLARIRDYRGPETTSDSLLSCLVLRNATFLPSVQWIGWGDERHWSRNIVAYKSYDRPSEEALLLRNLLDGIHSRAMPDLAPEFVLVRADGRSRVAMDQVRREGQGTFKLRLLQAYGWRCAITGEHALPVLDAAHIQPYLGPASNHVQNGLVLRADLHRLYDKGYITVTPDLRLAVSRRLRDEFDNGKVYTT